MIEKRRISIALEKITTDQGRQELKEFITKKDASGEFPNSAYFSLKLAAGMFLDTGKTDAVVEPYRNQAGLDIPFIADISVSGGYTAGYRLATGATNKLGITHPTYVLAAGLPADGVIGFKKHLEQADSRAKIMTTGALPENDTDSFTVEFNRDPASYTQMKTTEATKLGLFGVYAAAKYGIIDAPLGLAAGVSLDGESYMSDGVEREAAAFGYALEVSKLVLLGSVLEESGDITGYLQDAIRLVDLHNAQKI